MDAERPVVSTVTGRHHPRDPTLTVYARWPWDPGMLTNELVKSELPKRERAFDPGDNGQGGRPKGWWVTPAQLDRLVRLLIDRFGACQLDTEDGTCLIGPGGEVIEDPQTQLI